MVDYYDKYYYEDPPVVLNNGTGIKLTGDGETTEGITGHVIEENELSGLDSGIEL